LIRILVGNKIPEKICLSGNAPRFSKTLRKQEKEIEEREREREGGSENSSRLIVGKSVHSRVYFRKIIIKSPAIECLALECSRAKYRNTEISRIDSGYYASFVAMAVAVGNRRAICKRRNALALGENGFLLPWRDGRKFLTVHGSLHVTRSDC